MRIFLPDQDLLHETEEPMLTLARPLRTSWQTYGVILYSVPLEKFDGICEPYLKQSDSSIVLVDKNRKIFYEYTDGNLRAPEEWYVDNRIEAHTQYDKGRFCVHNPAVGGNRCLFGSGQRSGFAAGAAPSDTNDFAFVLHGCTDFFPAVH